MVSRKTESRPLTGIADEIAAADAAGRSDAPPTPEDVAAESGVPRIYPAMSMIMSKLAEQGISKDNTSTGVKFNYRSVDQVYAVLNPLLVEHNVILIPRYRFRETIERQTKNGTALYFTYVEAEFDFLSTLDGSKVTINTVGEAMDTSDKSANKAMAVAFKYAAFIAFCIPVEGEDNDPDAHGQEEIRPRAASQPRGKANEPAPLTEEEAKTNFREATTMLEACTSIAALKEAWGKINWERIPKGWHPELQKLQKEMVAELKKPAAPAPQQEPTRTPYKAPAFGEDTDDDIPF